MPANRPCSTAGGCEGNRNGEQPYDSGVQILFGKAWDDNFARSNIDA